MAAPGDRAPASGPPTFEPLRPATRGWRAFVFLAGPLLWLISLIAVAVALSRLQAIEFALAVLTVSLLIAVAVLVPMRTRRLREEESA